MELVNDKVLHQLRLKLKDSRKQVATIMKALKAERARAEQLNNHLQQLKQEKDWQFDYIVSQLKNLEASLKNDQVKSEEKLTSLRESNAVLEIENKRLRSLLAPGLGASDRKFHSLDLVELKQRKTRARHNEPKLEYPVTNLLASEPATRAIQKTVTYSQRLNDTKNEPAFTDAKLQMRRTKSASIPQDPSDPLDPSGSADSFDQIVYIPTPQPCTEDDVFAEAVTTETKFCAGHARYSDMSVMVIHDDDEDYLYGDKRETNNSHNYYLYGDKRRTIINPAKVDNNGFNKDAIPQNAGEYLQFLGNFKEVVKKRSRYKSEPGLSDDITAMFNTTRNKNKVHLQAKKNTQ